METKIYKEKEEHDEMIYLYAYLGEWEKEHPWTEPDRSNHIEDIQSFAIEVIDPHDCNNSAAEW